MDSDAQAMDVCYAMPCRCKDSVGDSMITNLAVPSAIVSIIDLAHTSSNGIGRYNWAHLWLRPLVSAM